MEERENGVRNVTWTHSRLDRIYATRRHTPALFNWKMGPTPMPTDHWLVSVKFAPKDTPDIGKGQWTWPLPSLKDETLIEKVIRQGIDL